MKLIVILCSIVVLFYWPVDGRRCYQCGCEYNWSTNSGTCSSLEFLATCSLVEVGNQYCYIISNYDGNNEQRVFQSLARDTFQDSHFFQAVETIAWSGTIWMQTQISSIGYGCDWDGCNDMSLAQYLPESFQMQIDQSELNNQLLNGQSPAQLCYSCSNCINDLTVTLCRSVACNNTGICYIDELHNYIVSATNNCTFNFFSYCESWNNPVLPPSIRIRATYYLDLPQEKQLEIDEVDIRCTRENCNSMETVEYLKGQIQPTVVINPNFRPTTPTSTTITTGGSTSTTSTQSSTTTSQGPKSTRSYPTIFLYLVVSLLML